MSEPSEIHEERAATGGDQGAVSERPAAEPSVKPAAAEPQAEASAPELPENVRPLQDALSSSTPVEGRVIGWNSGGCHVVVDKVTCFCPRSEMELGSPKDPESYLDQTFAFQVLKIHRRGRRIVLSRSAALKRERKAVQNERRKEIQAGTVVEGKVASLTDFGAFVDLGGVQGLVHVSELSRRRGVRPEDVVEVGQDVTVKVLSVENGGRRISLSIRALEPDPWDGAESRFEEGSVVTGRVERVEKFGAFVELAPGLTGLLPTSVMGLPRDAAPARVFPPGKEIAVQVLKVDRRRRRISLGLEGSATEGSSKDVEAYRQSSSGADAGFNALAAAFQKALGSSSD